jgi:hypothetical protein
MCVGGWGSLAGSSRAGEPLVGVGEEMETRSRRWGGGVGKEEIEGVLVGGNGVYPIWQRQ